MAKKHSMSGDLRNAKNFKLRFISCDRNAMPCTMRSVSLVKAARMLKH